MHLSGELSGSEIASFEPQTQLLADGLRAPYDNQQFPDAMHNHLALSPRRFTKCVAGLPAAANAVLRQGQRRSSE
jgi:hypothetical protein